MVDKKTHRKPVDKMTGNDSRDAIWKEIRRQKTFTIREIYLCTDLEISSVRQYVTGLVKAGYVTEDRESLSVGMKVLQTPIKYTLARDVGIDAPRVRQDGSLVTQGQGTVNMWRTMRILGNFTARELAVSATTETCSVKEDTAKSYIGHLCNAGYLRKTGDRYCFIPSRHTGPKPPMIQRVKRVWDPNLKKVMWSEEGGNHDEQ